MTDASHRYPDKLVGVPPQIGLFAPPFVFPSKDQQKLLINASALASSTLTNLQIGRNPTPLLQDGMNGFSLPDIQPPFSQSAKPRELRMPLTGQIQQLTTPQAGLMNESKKGLAEQQVMQITAANSQLRKNNVYGAEIVLGKHLTVEEISNQTITPQIRYTSDGKPTPVEFTPVGIKKGVPVPDPVNPRPQQEYQWGSEFAKSSSVPSDMSEDTVMVPNAPQQAPPLAPSMYGASNNDVLSNEGSSRIADVPVAPGFGNRTEATPRPSVDALLEARMALLNRGPAVRRENTEGPPSLEALLATRAGLQRSTNRTLAPLKPAEINVLSQIKERANNQQVLRDAGLPDSTATSEAIAKLESDLQSRMKHLRAGTEHFKSDVDDIKVDEHGNVVRAPGEGNVKRAAELMRQAEKEETKEQSRQIKDAMRHDAVLGGHHVVGADNDDHTKKQEDEYKTYLDRSAQSRPTHDVNMAIAPDQNDISDETRRRRRLIEEEKKDFDMEDFKMSPAQVQGGVNSRGRQSREALTSPRVDGTDLRALRQIKSAADKRYERRAYERENGIRKNPARKRTINTVRGEKNEQEAQAYLRANPTESKDNYTEYDVNALPEPPKDGKKKKGGSIGNFMIHFGKLRGGVVSLSYPNGRKVPGYPNAEVSPALQAQLFAMGSGIGPNHKHLTVGESGFIDGLIKRSNANYAQRGRKAAKQARESVKQTGALERAAARQKKGKVMVGFNNTSASQQAKILIGEMQAGNDSPQLRLKLRTLVTKHKDSLPTDLLVIIHQALIKNRS